MSFTEKTPQVSLLSVDHSQPTRQGLGNHTGHGLSTIDDVDSTTTISPTLTPTASRRDDRETSPFSPFYSHSATRLSLDAQKTESKTQIGVYESDLEACLAPAATTNTRSSLFPIMSSKVDTVWPGQHALKERKKLAKRRTGCWPLNTLTSKQQIAAKIFIAMLILGLAIGLGLGISKAVGGGIWKSSNA